MAGGLGDLAKPFIVLLCDIYIVVVVVVESVNPINYVQDSKWLTEQMTFDDFLKFYMFILFVKALASASKKLAIVKILNCLSVKLIWFLT